MKFLFALAAGIAGALCCGENLLPNSSFELGTAGWGVMNEVPKENGKFQALGVRSSKDSVHGASSLELRNPDGGLVVLCSPAVPVAPGEMYTFSVWLKASVSFPSFPRLTDAGMSSAGKFPFRKSGNAVNLSGRFPPVIRRSLCACSSVQRELCSRMRHSWSAGVPLPHTVLPLRWRRLLKCRKPGALRENGM